ncbi:placenta-specific gene 8 protein isoform X3 [Labeo rohita]|nr:placenta-specific gene 8 protein isoform X3 [Labeo rohita]
MTTVVVQTSQKSGWDSGICDCCHDMNSCCYGFWCFPCFMCTTTGEFGESTCLPLLDIFGPAILATFGIPVCVPPVSLGMRVAVRHKYDIGGSICEDIMVTCCCIWCSWCQMSREIKARKQSVTVVTTQPVIQTIPMATSQVFASQQSVGVIGASPAAFAPAVQMAPVSSVTTVVK